MEFILDMGMRVTSSFRHVKFVQEEKKKELTPLQERTPSMKVEKEKSENETPVDFHGRQRSQTEAKIPSFKRNEATVAL